MVQNFFDKAREEAKNPRPGPLSGLPISIKETFGLAGQAVTAGSRRMPPIYPREDAAAVKRLKAAGAIILARSNIPEFAMMGETENLLFGRTLNPLSPDRTCGGSSGGEGVLVATGATAFGLGNDILGSIRIPAAFCGVVGFKAAAGAIPPNQMWPTLAGFTASWLGIGPLTRSVRDARLVFEVLAGRNLSPYSDPSPKEMRLVIPDPFLLSFDDPTIETAYGEAQGILEDRGLRTERHGFPYVGKLFSQLPTFIAETFDPVLRSLLVTKEGQALSLIRESFDRMRGKASVYSGLFQLLAAFTLVRPRWGRTTEAFKRSLESKREDLHTYLGENGVLILPTIGLHAPKHGAMNRRSLRPGVNGTVTSTTFCNMMNLNAIALPFWPHQDPQTRLVPSVMLATAPGGEAALFRAAEILEEGIG